MQKVAVIEFPTEVVMFIDSFTIIGIFIGAATAVVLVIAMLRKRPGRDQD
jgi:hypothetical protein